ncbi:MAG: hypothetical protein J5663_02305 [Bacteroidaceae bacterium]|nr:hypothetical protein [Bacteroidaceae bacterium]
MSKSRFTHIKCGAIALLSLLSLHACNNKDDGELYPRLRSEFFDVYVNEDTTVQSVTLDNGRTFLMNDGHTIKAQVADTIIRCYGTLEIANDSSFVTVYEIHPALCFAPTPRKQYKPEVYYKNPVDVVTVYKARHYINVIIKSKISGIKDHAYDFVKDSISTSHATHKRTMHLTLFHWKPEEELEGYTQKQYLSAPMDESHYDPSEVFDSVALHIHTYDGIRVYTYGK